MTRGARAADRFGSSWTILEGTAREEFLSHDDQGNVVLHAVIEHEDRAISLFEPPLVVAFAQLGIGETRQTESSMRVVDSEDPRRQRERGTATREMTYVGDRAVRTPEGEVRAKCVEVTFTADLQRADVVDRVTFYVVPGEGVVARSRTQELKILGLLGTQSAETIVLDWDTR